MMTGVLKEIKVHEYRIAPLLFGAVFFVLFAFRFSGAEEPVPEGRSKHEDFIRAMEEASKFLGDDPDPETSEGMDLAAFVAQAEKSLKMYGEIPIGLDDVSFEERCRCDMIWHLCVGGLNSGLDAKLDRLNREMLDLWWSRVLSPMRSMVEDDKTRQRVLCYSTSITDFLRPIPVVEHPPYYRDVFARFFPSRENELSEDEQAGRAFQATLKSFRRMVNDGKTACPGKSDENIDAVLRMLENTDDPILKQISWITRNRPAFDTSKDIGGIFVDSREGNDFVEALESHIAGLPKDTAVETLDYLYDELYAAADRLCPNKTPRYSGPRIRRHEEICDFALSRGNAACQSAEFLAESWRDNPDFTPNEPFWVRLEKTLRIAMEHDRFRARALQGELLSTQARFGRIERLAPWKECRVIKQSDGRSPVYYYQSDGLPQYRFPRLVDGTLYLFRCDYHKGVLWLEMLDIATGKSRRTKSVPYPASKDYSFQVETSFVDEKNAYFGSRGDGIMVFPLDESEPWSFSTKNGLPSGMVHSLCSWNGRLYAGLGFTQPTSGEERGTWLVELDVEKRALLQTFVYREKEDEPAGNALPFTARPVKENEYATDLRFRFIVRDPKRNRLLIDVFYDANIRDEKRSGLWAYYPEKENWEHLYPFCQCFEGCQMLPDGERLLMSCNHAAFLVDLRKLPADDAVVLLGSWNGKSVSPRNGIKTDLPLVPFIRMDGRGAILGDYYWGPLTLPGRGPWFWARSPMDGSGRFELLELPPGEESSTWCPEHLTLATEDGNGLLVGDGKRIVLYTFNDHLNEPGTVSLVYPSLTFHHTTHRDSP